MRRSAALIVLLASVAVPLEPSHAAAAAAAATQATSDDQNRDIIVTAPPLFRDLQPERELDEDGIESYGVSTIDELLGEVQNELGDPDDQPMILVNGKRVDGLDEIGALPVEALRNLQVLPRGSAVRLGGTIGQRVINLTLRRNVRSATVTAAEKVATDGDWHAERGELLLTKVNGNTRANIALRGRGESNLFEHDRGIIQPTPFLPYALGGNVIAYPTNLANEIDPLLSAAAGQIVTVAPVPAGGSPTLAGFAAGANNPAVTDLGLYRTIRPETRNYDLNGTFSTELATWLSVNATLRLSRNTSAGFRGLPALLFVVPATNPASPFSRDVQIAAYGSNPLGYRSRRTSGEGSLTFNADWGSWTGNFNVKHDASSDISLNERQNVFGSIRLADTVDPFTTDLGSLITTQTDRFASHTVTSSALATVTGPAVQLPAGPLIATVEGFLEWDHSRGESSVSQFGNRDVHRAEQSGRVALAIPITSRDNGFGAALGNIDASAEYGRIHYSDAGGLNKEAVGLTWEPRPLLRLNGSFEDSEIPAPISTIGSPVIISPDVRVYDPLTGQTVDVVEVTGGNPNLKPQKTKIRRLSALLRLVPKLNLQLNAEYTDTDRRNFVSSLPEASAAVMLAFPDRYVRDSNGVLTRIDLRPVNFESDREKRLRWGFSMNARLGGGQPPVPLAPGAKRSAPRPSTYLQVTLNHTMVFSDKIVIRSGLAPVDLLGGGAIGIGGGRLRHQVDGSASLNSGGIGARIGVSWRGASELISRLNGTTIDTLHFSPVMTINTRVFADLKRFLPQSHWARGFRISLDVINLTNDRQGVRDSLGNTPLQYQPGYRDPLGRTIEIELRKVF